MLQTDNPLTNNRCCPACDGLCDDAIASDCSDRSMEAGDLSYCLYCGMLMRLTEEGFKLVSLEEFNQFSDPMKATLLRGAQVVKKFHQLHPEIVRPRKVDIQVGRP